MTTTIDKSSATKSALHESFISGTSGMSKCRCLGYINDSSGYLVVYPREAQIVCRISERFLAGDSLSQIVKGLQEKGISSPSGKATCGKEAISKFFSFGFRHHKYVQVILPVTVIRRLDCISADTKDVVLEKSRA